MFRAENQIHFVINKYFSKSRTVFEMTWQCGRAGLAADGDTTWRMRFACWMNKATDPLSKYAIFVAFLRQQWLRERALMLC